MAAPIEDYAAVGNCESMALIGRAGSIDWLSFPRFDSAACFSALLGDARNGRWLITPRALPRVTRRYCGDSMSKCDAALCVIDQKLFRLRSLIRCFT